MRLKRITAGVTAIFIIMSMSVLPARAASFDDIGSHWAKAAIERWSALGVLSGFDGKFRPDDPVTRGEMATVLNNMLKYPSQPYWVFEDVNPDAWYAGAAAALARQDIFRDNETRFGAGDKLTREEAAFLIARAFNTSQKTTPMKKFSDRDKLSDWAKPYVEGLYDLGFLSGFSDGGFHPSEMVTRAQVVTILNNMIDVCINKPGIYDSPEGAKALVTCPGVEIKNHKLKTIFISPGAGANGGRVKLEFEGMASGYIFIVSEDASSVLVFTKLPRGVQGGGNSMRKNLIPSVDTRFAGGIGTAKNPYRIKSAEQLRFIEDYMDYSNKRFIKDSCFELVNDITLSGVWRPLGMGEKPSEDHSFSGGIFDGQGHTISGININISSDDRSLAIGLFRGVSGVIKNLKVSGSVTVKDKGDTEKALRAGLLAGVLVKGTIENCSAEATINMVGYQSIAVGGLVGYAGDSAKIIECTSSGVITAAALKDDDGAQSGSHAGGLVGSVSKESLISDCGSTADVSMTGGFHAQSGGLIGGMADTKIEKSFALGKVHASGALLQNDAGGLIGQQTGKSEISRCWASGDVSAAGLATFPNMVGGFIGGLYEGKVSDCYALGNVEAEHCFIGGFAGRFGAPMERSYAAGKVTDKDSDSLPGIIGAGRTTGEHVVWSGDFLQSTGDPLFFDDTENLKGVIQKVSKADISIEATYTKHGWDFNKVWMLSGDGGYRLPILRGVREDLQCALTMPEHLR